MPEAIAGIGELLSIFSIDLRVRTTFLIKESAFIMHGDSVSDHVISNLSCLIHPIEYLRVKWNYLSH